MPVDESEVLSIQNIISSGAAVEPWPYIEVGQKVRIDDHAFRGLEGILVGRKGNQRVVVSVSLLRRSVALEIERSLISAVKPVEEPVVDAPADALLSGSTA
jgi:transcription antitermination factor NusG